MSQLSTFYPAPITAADLGLGAGSNATFGSIQNTPIGSTTPAAATFTTLTATTGVFTTLSAAPTVDLISAGSTATETPLTITHGRAALGDSLRLLFRPRGSANPNASAEIIARDPNVGGSPFCEMLIRVQNGERVRFPLSTPNQTSAGTIFAENIALASGGTMTSPDVLLFRDGAANILGQRNAANAQTLRIYNTWTDASNHERGFMRWSSNVFQIGSEKGGTGAARQLDLQVDGTTRMAFHPTGSWAQILGSGQSVVTNFIGMLHIKSGHGVPQLVCHTNTTTNGHEAAIGFGTTNADTSAGNHRIALRRISSSADCDFIFFIDGNERFRIKSDGLIQFQGTTSSFPAIKRSSAILQARLADDSAYTTIDALHRLQGTAPATSGATGTAGDIRYDADYIYVCTAANTWKRVAIATW